MKIGFIIALEEEIESKKIAWKTKKINNQMYHYLKKGNNEYFLLFSQIGKVNAANATSIMINQLGVDSIINMGTVGGISKKVKCNQACIVKYASYCDVDATEFKYRINQVPGESIIYETNDKLNLKIKNIIKSRTDLDIIENIKLATSDSFITSKNKKNFHIDKSIDIIDMEGTSILQEANKNKTKVSIIKFISDTTTDKNNWKQWESNVFKIKFNITKIMKEIINNG